MKEDRRFTYNQNTDDEDEFLDDNDDIEILSIDENETEYTDEAAADESEYEANPKIKKDNKFKFIIAAMIAVIVVGCVIGGIIIEKNTPSKKRISLNDYFNASVNTDETSIVINGELTEYKALYRSGIYYLPIDFISENLTDKFYYESEYKDILYTTAYDIYTIPLDSMDYDINGNIKEETYTIALYENDKLYIAVGFLKDKSGFSYNVMETPRVISIYLDGTSYKICSITKNCVIRENASIKASIVEDGIVGSEWYILEDDEKQGSWTHIMNVYGVKGYIQNAFIGDENLNKQYESGYEKEIYPNQLRNYPILLVWHGVYSETDNTKIDKLLRDTKGITTVSPTWYKVINSEGDITSMADRDYIDYIHDQGIEIWPLISDFTSADPDNGWDEKQLFSNKSSRKNLIENIIREVNTYKYDGINIDFEKVPKDAGLDYIEFIRELSIACRKAEIVLSIDNYVPMNHNLYYNRKAQGECADYIIIMGYDEHYNGSAEAGSVSSLPFVEAGINATLSEVEADKVINAVPFYTRMFMEGTDENGDYYIESKAYGMQKAIDTAKELGLEVVWNDTDMQNVATGYNDGIKYSVWLEDLSSMKKKIEKIKEYNIAGIAAWSLGTEMNGVWNILNE